MARSTMLESRRWRERRLAFRRVSESITVAIVGECGGVQEALPDGEDRYGGRRRRKTEMKLNDVLCECAFYVRDKHCA